MNNWTVMVYISADDVLANFAVESLKQLKRAAGNGVIVAAQFDANKQKDVPRFAFDGTGDLDSSIGDDQKDLVSKPVNMTDSGTLKAFINWASKHYEAEHYCLILWGHGYELLLDLDYDQANQTNRSARRYLTPANLKRALENTNLGLQGRALDILAIDACSMSLIEIASDLQGCVEYMVASQEEVPDASFPYEKLLSWLKNENPDRTVAGISAAIPMLYKQAYQDYLIAPSNGMRTITLSTLRLSEIDQITKLLKRLADILLSSTSDPDLRKAIVSARRDARDFAFGLFVDLSDFCKQLKDKVTGELKSACEEICEAVSKRGDDSFVIANQTGEKDRNEEERCHGISVYFPYLTNGVDQRVQISLVAAQTTLLDQLPLLVKGGTNNLRKEQNGKIQDLEADFRQLTRFRQTNWNNFIAHGWSFILAKEDPQGVELHYSAQQCAANLLSLYEESEPGVLFKVA
jgi:hypothetical protein